MTSDQGHDPHGTAATCPYSHTDHTQHYKNRDFFLYMLIVTFIFDSLFSNSTWIKLRLSAWEAVWMERDQMKDLLFIIIMSPDALVTVPFKIISSWFSSL